MVVFSVPESGLVLDDFSMTNDDEHVGTSTQIMQLDLTDGTIEELFRCARKGNPIHVAFGKSIVSSKYHCHGHGTNGTNIAVTSIWN